MANVVEGVVAVIMDSKFDDTKRIKLEDGGWYGASEDMASRIRKGATVKLKVERRGKNTLVQAVKELSPPAEGSSSGGGRSGGGAGRRGGYQADPAREASIHYQSSRKDALALLAIQAELGILKLGSKAAEKENVLMAKLDILTAAFHEDIGTLGAVKRVQEEADEDEDFDPDSDEDMEDEDFGDEEEDDDDF